MESARRENDPAGMSASYANMRDRAWGLIADIATGDLID
jgi:hypothetical protein